MGDGFNAMGQNKIDRINRVSYTDYDFMNTTNARRERFFHKSSEEEPVPPADRSVFDQPPHDDGDDDDDVQPYEFDALKLSSMDWTNEPFTSGVSTSSNIFDDDLIRVPSLDSEMKWSPQNPLITVPNIGRASLVRAATSGRGASIQGAQLTILEELKRMTHDQSTAQTKANDWISESEITEDDVICERGGKSNRHAGTKKYRGMVEKFKSKYQSLNAKIDKTNLSRHIISQIQDNNGRFLKRGDQPGQYFVLCKVETTKKVSQALREKKVLKWTDDA
jgi:hypothetical protein